MDELLCAINRAAQCLPGGCEIMLTVERGAAWITVDAHGESRDVEPNDRTLAQQIDSEVDRLLAISKRLEG